MNGSSPWSIASGKTPPLSMPLVINEDQALTEQAIELMVRFAERTGLTPEGPQQRYLWTDAFAVCNFLGLARATRDQSYGGLALTLVDRVHEVLGKHRPDDSRVGWLNGLPEQMGALHPTRGGLRIGKRLPERQADEPFDPQVEWDRDGQYLHYLTRWMHALNQVARATGQGRFNLWARELAEAAYRGFQQRSPRGEPPRLAWKMSIDLSRPLVPSTGQHDPLDGFITCLELRHTASLFASESAGPDLDEAIAGLGRMVEGGDWVTADPLGIGGLLMDAERLHQLVIRASLPHQQLLRSLLTAALAGLRHYIRMGELDQPASRRLAFRELGLAIGLQAIARTEQDPQAASNSDSSSAQVRDLLDAVTAHASVGLIIRRFWLDPVHRRHPTWTAHGDINDVMLATNLLSAGGSTLVSVNETLNAR